MKIAFLRAALAAAPPALIAASGPQPALAQQTVTFLCDAPTGHVCQFSIKTAGGPIDFALPAGERKELSGVTPHADKYCVCDPGPVTPDCKAPRLDHWCLGSWVDVDTGLNSENDDRQDLFGATPDVAPKG